MKIGIVGMGLIGGSLGRALIKRTDHKVFAFDISEKSMQKALLLNACHKELEENDLPELDLLIIALYPRLVGDYIDQYCGKMKPGAIVMDCGGNKRSVNKIMAEKSVIFDKLHFIGAHPMAGREFCGIEHSSVNLFEKASVLICPINPEISVLMSVKQFYLDLGFGDVIITTPEKHDSIIAFTSQIAHVISNAYVKSPTATQHIGYSAGSFRDLSRVAKLNQAMWSELMIDNRDNLVRELDLFIENIGKYRNALVDRDEEKLKELLKDGTDIKADIDTLKKNETYIKPVCVSCVYPGIK